jgi:hypothetical protein
MSRWIRSSARGLGHARGVAIRRYPSLDAAPSPEDDDASDTGARRRWRIMERETGFEPATLSLGKGRKPKKW